MLENFIHAKTEESFKELLEQGSIQNDAVVFMEDTGRIWSNGAYYANLNDVYEVLSNTKEFNPTKDYNVATKKYVDDALNNITMMNLYAYGVEWDVTIANPVLTRIGNMSLHKTLPIQSAYRGCVANGGKINYYLDPNDWSKRENGTTAVLDGSEGTVKVHTPKFYGKSEEEGNKRRVWISTKQIDSTWDEIPELLVDAYRCTLDTSGSTVKAVSVVNTTAAFRGGGNRSEYDSYLESDPCRSDLGKPRTNQSRANMRTYARNNGAELLSYEQYKWIFYWAYVIEYANFNSQATYTADLTSEGCHQGGLGEGVTIANGNYWNYYNRYHPLTPCGYCNEIGNGTGVKSMQVIMPTTSGGTPSQTYNFSVPRWRGFDNPFGDIWTNLDGILIDTPTSGASDTSVLPTCYIIPDSSEYTDSLTDIDAKYVRSYKQPHDGGYTKEWHLGGHADIVPKVVGGSSTTYMCDYYYWVNYDDTPETLRVGGGAHGGSNAGLGLFHSDHCVGDTNAGVGFRTVHTVEK